MEEEKLKNKKSLKESELGFHGCCLAASNKRNEA